MTRESPAELPEAIADELIADWERAGRASRGAPQIVPPPASPMLVARAYVESVHTDADGYLLLRDHGGDFYRYDGTCWPEVEVRALRAGVYEWLEEAVYATEKGPAAWDPNRRKVGDVLEALRAVAHLDAGVPPLWDPVPYEAPPAADTISMANGLLRVPTRMLYPHMPQFFTHHALPFAFEEDAPEPTKWLSFLAELWPDDPKAIEALQEAIGYVIGGATRLQKIILAVGPRRGGKGTIGRILTGLLGPHNVAAPTMAALGTNFGLQPLIGKPLALISDARLSGRSDGVVVERLLSISGEDSLTIDRKYREPWTGRLPTRFVILTNEPPRLSDSSGALASRFVTFVLTESFLGRENPRLTDELLEEAPSIFNWALEGLDRLNHRGYLVQPESGREAVRELEDLASPVSAFVRDRCQVGSDLSISVDRLWAAWKCWCEEENRHPGTRAVFGRNLKASAPQVRKTRPRGDHERRHVYVGIAVRAPGGSTVSGHRDHRDRAGRSRQGSGVGHGSRSRRDAPSDAAGHGGHGEYAEPRPDDLDLELDAELDDAVGGAP